MSTTRMPFGKHKGRPVGEIPLDYLRWLIGSNVRLGNDFRREIEYVVAARIQRINQLPEPCTVSTQPGEDLAAARDADEEALYNQAVSDGELVITPDMPFSSRVPGWYREWCECWGHPYRVREITWAEYDAAIKAGEYP